MRLSGAHIPNISGEGVPNILGPTFRVQYNNYINVSIKYIGRSGTELVSSDIHFLGPTFDRL